MKAIDARGAAVALLLSVFWGVLAWGWVTGRPLGFRIDRHEWRPLLVLALLCSAQIASMNIGTAMTTAAHASVRLNLYAVHTSCSHTS